MKVNCPLAQCLTKSSEGLADEAFPLPIGTFQHTSPCRGRSAPELFRNAPCDIGARKKDHTDSERPFWKSENQALARGEQHTAVRSAHKNFLMLEKLAASLLQERVAQSIFDLVEPL